MNDIFDQFFYLRNKGVVHGTKYVFETYIF